MKFRSGQKVLCVNDHFNAPCGNRVKKGHIYTVQGYYKCPCGSRQVALIEYPAHTPMSCRCPGITYRRQTFYEWRFIPIEYFEMFLGASKNQDHPESSYKVKQKGYCHAQAAH